MTTGLDTSVVLRLLTGAPPAQAQAALEWLLVQRANGIVLTVSDLVISEIYYALQHHFRVPKQEALDKLAAFLGSGDVMAMGVAATVLATPGLATAKPGFVDRIIHQQYLQAGAGRIGTFERSAARLPHVQVLAAEAHTPQ